MTSYLKLTGSYYQMNDLFENAHFISVRHFKLISNNYWDLTVRDSEYYHQMVEKFSSAKTIAELLQIDNSRSTTTT